MIVNHDFTYFRQIGGSKNVLYSQVQNKRGGRGDSNKQGGWKFV